MRSTPRYFACFSFFALFWIWFTDICDIGLETYRDAFYLSVETQMTIGYGDLAAENTWCRVCRASIAKVFLILTLEDVGRRQFSLLSRRWSD